MESLNNTDTISYLLSKAFPFVLLGVLGFNLIQMLFKAGWNRKRFASFYMTCLVGGLTVISILFVQYGVHDLFLIPAFAIAIIIPIVKRKEFFPFSLACAKCGSGISIGKILFEDPAYCDSCEKIESGDGQGNMGHL
jgi:hypothetical protein